MRDHAGSGSPANTGHQADETANNAVPPLMPIALGEISMTRSEKPRVFISYSSQDKEFSSRLARNIRIFNSRIWYDEWEIAVGESIVDRVFSGLEASDVLVIVLSPASVQSRWVKEELNVAVMRRLTESDIRILPALIATCDMPVPLRHIRYADFRLGFEEGLADLLDSLSPGYRLWQPLRHLYDHFCLLVDQISTTDLDSVAAYDLIKLHDLLDSALGLRTEIELRQARQRLRNLNFFEKIDLLVESGVDVRSQTWNELVGVRAVLAHNVRGHQGILYDFSVRLRERHPADNLRDSLVRGLDRLKDIMRMICIAPWEAIGRRVSPEAPNPGHQADG